MPEKPCFHWPEAVAGPTAFNVVSSVIANFTSGKHLKALHVTSLTASLVFVCTSWVRRGLNFPRCKRTIAYLIFFDQYDFIWLKWICTFIVDQVTISYEILRRVLHISWQTLNPVGFQKHPNYIKISTSLNFPRLSLCTWIFQM